MDNSLYQICKEEISSFVQKHIDNLILKCKPKIIDTIVEMKENFDLALEWEEDFIKTTILPYVRSKLKESLEKDTLPYIESLADHYVDEILPFRSELLEKIVDDNLHHLIECLFQEIQKDL
jgi:hypothetical protein